MANLDRIGNFRFSNGKVGSGHHIILHPEIRGDLKSGDNVAIIHMGDFIEHIESVNKILGLNKDIFDLFELFVDILKDDTVHLNQLKKELKELKEG